MELDIPGLKKGRMARDRGISITEKAERARWMHLALLMVRAAAISKNTSTFTTDYIRHWCKHYNLPAPHSGSVWGAVMLQAIKRGYVIKTGEYVQTTIPTSHARAIPVYRSGFGSVR
jgi:hypothetical protein